MTVDASNEESGAGPTSSSSGAYVMSVLPPSMGTRSSAVPWIVAGGQPPASSDHGGRRILSVACAQREETGGARRVCDETARVERRDGLSQIVISARHRPRQRDAQCEERGSTRRHTSHSGSAHKRPNFGVRARSEQQSLANSLGRTSNRGREDRPKLWLSCCRDRRRGESRS